MGSQYYFAATLPSLQFGSPPPFTSAAFLDQAASHLSAEEMGILSGLRLAPGPGDRAPAKPELAARYAAWEGTLRAELATLRAGRLGRQADAKGPKAVLDDWSAINTARSAFQAQTPLEGELAIERARWAFIDSASPIQLFDFQGLCAYRLKLLILERLSALSVERGEAGYREVYTAILAAHGGRPADGTQPE